MTAFVRGISVDGRAGSIDQNGKRDYTLIYKVYTNDRNDGPVAVRTAIGIPEVGDTYHPGNDLDISAVVIDKQVTQGDSPWEWLVEVRYSTDPGLKPPQAFTNPLDEPAEMWYTWQERRIPVPGYHQDPAAPPNSKLWYVGIYLPNGELFNPQPEVDVSEPILNIRRTVQTIVPATLMALANCVNLDTFQGAEPRQLRFKPPTATRKWHKNIGYYFEVVYQLEFRWETWDIQLRNDGTYYWSAGRPALYWSSTVRPDVKLDKMGNPLVVNLTTAGNINQTANPTFTRIRFYREVNFASLELL